MWSDWWSTSAEKVEGFVRQCFTRHCSCAWKDSDFFDVIVALLFLLTQASGDQQRLELRHLMVYAQAVWRKRVIDKQVCNLQFLYLTHQLD